MALHSDSARMHRTSSYQSRKISFSFAENLGSRLVEGPFFSRDVIDSSAWRSVAVADLRVACCSCLRPWPKFVEEVVVLFHLCLH